MLALPDRSFAKVAPDWLPLIQEALDGVDPSYLNRLVVEDNWLPGINQLFAAFSLPLSQLKYILLGESPYPRMTSANGYAFWDGAVQSLWSPKGLETKVNRATSLRNLIKMLLLAKGRLSQQDISQSAIAHLSKDDLVQTAPAFFENVMERGILLLNASLVLSENSVKNDARAWQPFLIALIKALDKRNYRPQFLLLGAIAQLVLPLIPPTWPRPMVAEHPYNLSFITNPKVQAFFKPLDLLQR